MAWHPLPSEVGEWKQLLHWRDDVQAQLQQARNRQQQLQRHPYRHRAVLDGRQRLIQTLEAEPARAEQAIKEQVKRHAGISRQGERSVRSRLYMGALGGIRGENPLQVFYHRLVARGKAKKVVLVAAARKLLIGAWAVFHSHTPCDAPVTPLDS